MASFLHSLWKKFLVSRNNNITLFLLPSSSSIHQTRRTIAAVAAAGGSFISSPWPRTEDEFKAMFEEWAVNYQKSYANPVEKEWSFEHFKRRVKDLGPRYFAEEDQGPGRCIPRWVVIPPPQPRRPGDPNEYRVIELGSDMDEG